MSAVLDLPRLRIASPSSHTTVVSPYGFDMEVDYEYQEGEAPILWPTDDAHPGSPPNAVLLACRVGGEDIYPMLTSSQVENIEDAILEQHE